MQTQTQTIDRSILDMPVEGVNLRPGTLADQLGPAPTLLVFLRHFGCIFCQETVRDLRQIAASDPSYPPVLFVYQGSSTDGTAFFERFWPEARAIADMPRRLYQAFGVQRGGVWEMLGPEVWACGLRAAGKGNTGGLPVGDPWIMPGLFLVAGDTIRWQHSFRHAGDHPDFAQIPAQV
ncbi:MAG: SelL-related redox protein [Chloroflexaceae bacterium]